mgnify:CR=1 FL=1
MEVATVQGLARWVADQDLERRRNARLPARDFLLDDWARQFFITCFIHFLRYVFTSLLCCCSQI